MSRRMKANENKKLVLAENFNAPFTSCPPSSACAGRYTLDLHHVQRGLAGHPAAHLAAGRPVDRLAVGLPAADHLLDHLVVGHSALADPVDRYFAAARSVAALVLPVRFALVLAAVVHDSCRRPR